MRSPAAAPGTVACVRVNVATGRPSVTSVDPECPNAVVPKIQLSNRENSPAPQSKNPVYPPTSSPE